MLAEKAGGLYRGSLNKWYVDVFYNRIFIQPTKQAAAWLWKKVDVRIVDGAVNGVGKTVLTLARGMRLAQTGQLQNYALVMVVGAFVILTVYWIFL